MQVEILRIISRTYQVVLYPYIFLLPLFGSEFRCADHRASTMENPGNSPARGWDKLEGAQVPYIFTQDSNFRSFESLLFALLWSSQTQILNSTKRKEEKLRRKPAGKWCRTMGAGQLMQGRPGRKAKLRRDWDLFYLFACFTVFRNTEEE